MAKYVNLDAKIIITLEDETKGGMVFETQMSVGEFFEKFKIDIADIVEEGTLATESIALPLRPCRIGERTGRFHRWTDIARVLPPSPMKGGSPGGQVWLVVGLVELDDGRMETAAPTEIVFTDRRNGNG